MKKTEIFACRGWSDPVFILRRKPPSERIHFLREPNHGFIGDYAWHNSKAPEDDFIHCTGYTKTWIPVWYADISLDELEFIREKPEYSATNPPPKICPYPITNTLNENGA